MLGRTIRTILEVRREASILETVFSGNLSSCLKGVKPLPLYDVDRGVVMEPMQGKLASSQFDFGYIEQF